MANNPITTPLPADLPTDWVYGQTIGPQGTDVGLTQQHGYNYLMQQVNAAQQAATQIGQAFSGIPSSSDLQNVQTNLTDHINNQNNPHDVTAEQLGALAAVAAYYNSSTTDGVLDTFTAPTAIVYLSSSINHDLWETLNKSSWAYVIQIFHSRIDAANSRVQIATGSNARFAVRYYSATSGKWGNWSAMATADGLDAHINNKNNPHRVTAAQVGAKADFSILPVSQGGTGVPTIAQLAQSLFPTSIGSLPDTSYNFAITGPQWNGNGYMSFQALMSQLAANSVCRIATGTYTGTGDYQVITIVFPFSPTFFAIPTFYWSNTSGSYVGSPAVGNGDSFPIIVLSSLQQNVIKYVSALGYQATATYDPNTRTLTIRTGNSYNPNGAGSIYYWIAI